MLCYAIAFLLGDVLLQQCKTLPNVYWVFGMLSVIFLTLFTSYFRIVGMFLLGFAWALWYAHLSTAWVLSKDLEGKSIWLDGYIASIPSVSLYGTSWIFSTNKTFIKLSSQKTNLHLKVGDRWKLNVKLKRIHSTFNPNSFDYEAWAMQQGIRAVGYVINKSESTWISSDWYHFPLGRIRQTLQDKLIHALTPSVTSPWIIALAVGEHHGISQENWKILRDTGTNHLMAIAGLHIGCMSGLMYVIVNALWRRFFYLTLRLPAQHAASIGALFMALIYGALAGFSIPTQRACIMLMLFLMAVLCRRQSTSWAAWSIALFLVLAMNPTCVLTESFWLSFGSVALIIYGVSGRLAPGGLWWKYGRIQWVIGLGLVPLSIWLFQQCSLISFIANSIAIPIVGFVIVPLVLLGCFTSIFSTVITKMVLFSADTLLGFVWKFLSFLSHIKWAVWYQSVPDPIVFFSLIGMMLLLLPIGMPGRWFGLIWLFPLIFYKPISPAIGEIRFTLLDVGQGLSAIVQTAKHSLVFDAGPRWGDIDMGETVVVPYLRSMGIRQLDRLVVSHGDNDHIGGARAVLSVYPNAIVKTSVPELLANFSVSYCLRGENWDWDGVQFEFMYPPATLLGLNNNSSCVLHIHNKAHSILLTGDIEKIAEKFLHEEAANGLRADILVAPHHGSKTSANYDFLNDVGAKVVLFPIGYRNRYHFPHPSVIARYEQLQTTMYNTVMNGAMSFSLTEQKEFSARFFRLDHKHYWND